MGACRRAGVGRPGFRQQYARAGARRRGRGCAAGVAPMCSATGENGGGIREKYVNDRVEHRERQRSSTWKTRSPPDRSHEVNFARTRVLITLEASNPIAAANSISSITSIRRWPLSTVATNDCWRQGAAGISDVDTGLGSALNQNQNTLANLNFGAQTGIGNANPDFSSNQVHRGCEISEKCFCEKRLRGWQEFPDADRV